MALAVGVLPYPLTFLCTDLICELYGKARANFLVSVGLGLNFLILGVLLLGNSLPSVPAESMPPWQILQLAAPVALPNGEVVEQSVGLYQLIYATTSGAVFASMLAYIAAQYCDVQLFHFWKRITKGKYLWVRNNFSTLMSQMVDSVMVITVTFGAAFYRGEMTLNTLLILVGSNYVFKAAIAPAGHRAVLSGCALPARLPAAGAGDTAAPHRRRRAIYQQLGRQGLASLSDNVAGQLFGNIISVAMTIICTCQNF